MFARVTSFEVDTVRFDFNEATSFFENDVLPEIRRQPGYSGVLLMRTPDGHGLLLTFWETEDDARAGVASGFYQEQVAKFLTIMRQPPGREQYAVLRFEGIPALSTS